MATKKTIAAEAEVKKVCKRTCAKKATNNGIYNAINVGFKAGDVYQALAAAEKPLTVKEIAKAANISDIETLLGMGWLLKEGKIAENNDKIQLA